MGEDFFTCECGQPTSDYRGKQCMDCDNMYCSKQCIKKYCCGNKLTKKVLNQINKYQKKIDELQQKIDELRTPNNSDNESDEE